MIKQPLDPFSEVVDEKRRWNPEWYSWLTAATIEAASIVEVAVAMNEAIATATTRFKFGSFSRSLSAASGTQAITGVGFRPRALILLGGRADVAIGPHSIGITTTAGSGGSMFLNVTAAASFVNISDGRVVFAGSDANNFQQATILSIDSDGFTLNWTKINLPTGTGSFTYLAMG